MRKTAILLALALPLLAAGQQRDWANYGRYAAANAALTTAPAVVFMGNSITDGWDNAHPEFFTDNNFACRGIGGQVTSQMLCRFRADVIDLRPKAVVILAGTNDIAGNNGPIECGHIVETSSRWPSWHSPRASARSSARCCRPRNIRGAPRSNRCPKRSPP